MTGKSQECYHQAFSTLIHDSDHKIFPFSVGVDFEVTFFKTAKHFFPKAHILGCAFHWKQAIRRKMVNMCIPEDQISYSMKFGVLDILTVIPVADLLQKGIPFVRTMIADKFFPEPMELWDEFFDEYFIK